MFISRLQMDQLDQYSSTRLWVDMLPLSTKAYILVESVVVRLTLEGTPWRTIVVGYHAAQDSRPVLSWHVRYSFPRITLEIRYVLDLFIAWGISPAF